MCNGSLIHVPCSRVIHLSKKFSAYRKVDYAGDYFAYNLKRVAEVWMDDYKQYFYKTDPNRYDKIDAGDLTNELAIKKNLKCKPFKYYLEEVAPKILELYPLVPQYFATGTIQSLGNMKCLKLNTHRTPLRFESCTTASKFTLTFRQSLRFNDNTDQCLESTKLLFDNCYYQNGAQMWIYNITTHQIKTPYGERCLTERDESVLLENCDETMNSQKWKWSVENATALINLLG